MGEGLRLSEILTTSSAVANYRGVQNVRARDVLDAVAMLRGEKTLDDLGRPLSPIVSRISGAGSGATEGVRELAQRWFAVLGEDPRAELDDEQLREFELELAALADGEA